MSYVTYSLCLGRKKYIYIYISLAYHFIIIYFSSAYWKWLYLIFEEEESFQ